MKKTLSLLLVLAMVLSSFGFAFAAEDEIVPAEFLNEKGILKGNAEGNLMLEDNLKRQDMVVMLSRLLGVEEEAKAYEGETTFTDIADPFYVPYIAWAEAEELTEGVGDNKFGFDRAVKENEVAAFLLRALGYTDVAWEDVPAKAVELGLVEKDVDLTVDAKREVLAELTYKALGMKMKDSEKTLAEHLEIEMPVPEKLEVEEVVADNLKEIKVVFNKAVDAESAINPNNYDTDAGDIEDVVYLEDENVAILTLEKAMKNKEDYEITIDGVKDDKTVLDVDKEFKAVDNAIPEVVEVVGLGTKAIKVVMSEPVKTDGKTNFALDGKTIYGTFKPAGRDIIVKTYSDISVGEHELTVKNLKDYADFKSLETKHTFEVVEDKDAPTVVEVKAPALEKVIVTFSEDVDTTTVNTKTIYHKDRGTKIYPDDVKPLAGNKYAFTFSGDNGLPLHETTIYVEGVKDYSGNKMAADEVAVKASIDETRPAVKEVNISVSRKVVTVTFTKLVDITDAKFTVLDEDSDKLTISEIKPSNTKTSSKSVDIVLGKALDADEEYTLKITGIKDTNKYANYMADYSEKISTSDLGQPKLGPVVINCDATDDDVAVYTINVFFDKAMDLSTIANPVNYLVEIDNANKLLSKLDNDIEIKDADGKKVEIIITLDKDDDGSYSNITGIAGLDIKGANGKGLANYGKIVSHNYVSFDKATAVATAKDTVEVTFAKDIKTAPKAAFKLGTLEIESAEIDGEVVTLTLVDKTSNKLSANASEKLEIVENKVIAYDGDKYAVSGDIDVVDEIAPSIDEIVEDVDTDGTVTLTVKFDETVTFKDTDKAFIKEYELIVKRNEGVKKVVYDIVNTADGEGNIKSDEINIRMTPAQIGVDRTKFTVTFNGLGIIKDVTEGNKLAKVTKESDFVENILHKGADPVVEQIAALPEVANLTLENKAAVEAARAAYDALTAEQQKLVTNLDVLEAAEAKIAALEAAAAAQDAVNAEAAKITAELTFEVADADKADATKVTAAAVTAAQAKVSEGYTVTAKAEGTIDELKLTVTFVVTKNDTEFKAETGELTLTFTAE